MGRKPRKEAKGELYHIIQQGHNKSYIFGNLHDKIMFFELLKGVLAKCSLTLHYYVLMDNHFHLILEMGDIPLHKGMQSLNQNYSRYFNKCYNRCGTVYDGRYSGKRITSDSHYFQLLRYQAYNPVLAGIVKYPGEYRWSAHRALLERNDEFIDTSRVLARFSRIPEQAVQRYREFIESDKPDMKSLCNDEKVPRYISPPKEHLQYIFDEMELSVEERQLFFSRFRGDGVVAMRRSFIRKAVPAGHPLSDIAEFLKVSYETVRRSVSDP